MGLLLGARALQGLVAGAGMIMGRTVVRDLFDGVHAQRIMSHTSLIFAVAPAIAPLVGGWVLGWSSWRMIFWLLAAFRAAATDSAVLRLSTAIGLNFAALFLYISSAPAIVVDHLGLGAQDFGILFVPIVASMMLGSFVTGRLVGRVRSDLFILSGFVMSLAGAAYAVGYRLTVADPSLVGVLVPVSAAALGVSLVFPILTTDLLDLRPRERGSVSSFQSFLSTCLNAVVAGIVSPAVSGSLLLLAVVAGSCTGGALLLWSWHRRIARRSAATTGSPGAPSVGVVGA